MRWAPAAWRVAINPLRSRRAQPQRLSHANKVRNWELAQSLFYQVLEHLQSLSPRFACAKGNRRFARRFK